ncbi:MAG TPA: helix-turn-helix domain-containing protein [Clostridia bacterium]|nr:helix-turn-helix domain-containing protein [Clostridia bacterium]
MSFNSGNTRPYNADGAAIPPSVFNTQQQAASHVPPTSRELQRFIERKRYQELGYELPMNSKEAAAYIGYHQKTVERMAREGEIPAHPASGVRRKTWKFYASELDAWLRGKVSSRRHPCSPNGKDTVQ